MAYVPDPQFVTKILTELTSSLPFVARMAVKGIPMALKEPAMRLALSQAIPLSFSAIAMSQDKGSVVPLTRNGALTEKAKESLVKRIAVALVPNEVHAMTDALYAEVARLGAAGYAETSWELKQDGKETVLVVKDTSLLKSSADTVVDLFFDSVAALKATKATIAGWFAR
jgi:hypothetical protein